MKKHNKYQDLILFIQDKIDYVKQELWAADALKLPTVRKYLQKQLETYEEILEKVEGFE